MKRFHLSGFNMETKDYDGRTALHLAAAEGHLNIVKYLLEQCNVSPAPLDRWGGTPLDEAGKSNKRIKRNDNRQTDIDLFQ